MFASHGGNPCEAIVQNTLVWAFLCLSSAGVYLARRPKEGPRAFSLTIAVWGGIYLVFGILGVACLLTGPMDAAALRRLLMASGAIGAVCVLAGVALLTRPRDQLRGTGAALVLLGAARLILDLYDTQVLLAS